MPSAEGQTKAIGRPALVAVAVNVFVIMHFFVGHVRPDDWPTYRHDQRRSGVTPERIDATKLTVAWTYRSPQPPRPAWAGPAKWDAYARIRGLRSMREYDPVYHAIVVGDSLFFGSTSDDGVHCLDTKTGKERWVFFTDAPVRVVPTWSEGRLYFGSDDGHAYCVDARDGALLWKRAPTPPGRLIVHNGRMVSLSPCRTGVLVDGGTAYFANSLLPWKPSWLCAVDSKTGEPSGDGRYIRELRDVTLEGALLASARRLIAPQGRVPPLLFSRQDGKKAGSLEGGGGCFVLLTPDSRILHGPGNKTGWITDSKEDTRARLATYNGGNAMIVAGNATFLLTDRSLAGFEITAGKPRAKWQTECEYPFSLILAGGTLFVGGVDEVAAFAATTGEKVWTARVDGKAHGLVLANGNLIVSTDKGVIHAFQPGASGASAVAGAEKIAPFKKPTGSSVDLPVLEVPPFERPGLLGRWVFQRGAIAKGRVTDQVGKLSGRILGRLRLASVGENAQAIDLDGESNSVRLLDDHRKTELPKETISAEAWVRVDRPLTWGGIVGAFQDNGSYEKGWILGYTGSRFSFAISARGGKGSMDYVAARSAFEAEKWYHVVGTYDGEEIRIYVDGKLEKSSRSQRGPIDYPPRAFYEIGSYHDDDENFRLQGMLHEVRVYNQVLTPKEVVAHSKTRTLTSPKRDELELAAGPFLRFDSPSSAIVRWETKEPSTTVVRYGLGTDLDRQIEGAVESIRHEVRLDGLVPGRLHSYVIEARSGERVSRTSLYECDNFFNFMLSDIPRAREAFADLSKLSKDVEWDDLLGRLLADAETHRGMAVVVGIVEGRLPYELARRTRLRVLAVDTDAERIRRARERAYAAGVQGDRLAFRRLESLDRLPFTSCFANLVLSERAILASESVSTKTEMLRIVRASGGVVYPGASIARAARIVRGPLVGAGEWSHQYGAPNNSAFGGESLAGARSASDLDVQWIGRPGPRAQPDRNGRKPSPLSTGGRLFVQGLQRLIALDAFNGQILWSWEIPPLGRFNLPRDCSNWCADERNVFVVIGDRCWPIDARTGALHDGVEVPAGGRVGVDYDWGYVARSGDYLLGSAVKKGSSFTNFWGKKDEGWYDAERGPATFKVTSDFLFAMYPRSNGVMWKYSRGVVLNSTITVSDGRVLFVECRNEKVVQHKSGRIGAPELWKEQFLVALDIKGGDTLWEKPIDTADGEAVFYLAAQRGSVAIVASGKKAYHTYVFDAATGALRWDDGFRWAKGHHGEHMARPALVGGTLFVRPRVYDLASGRVLGKRMPDGGCGTYAATSGAFFYRNGNVTVWDPQSGGVSSWSRLRPDCWLSTIPAAGMLLSPEAGGGCSCGSWLETSVGFLPSSHNPFPKR